MTLGGIINVHLHFDVALVASVGVLREESGNKFL